MLRQISLAWRNVKNNRRTIGLLSLDNWRGVKLWRNKDELSTLEKRAKGLHISSNRKKDDRKKDRYQLVDSFAI